MTTPATLACLQDFDHAYAAAVREIADDVIRQLEDRHAPHRRENALAAGGHYFESVRVFFADVHGRAHGLPDGIARVALDMSPINPRRPAHEVRVALHAYSEAWETADDIAAAVLEMLDPLADYAR